MGLCKERRMSEQLRVACTLVMVPQHCFKITLCFLAWTGQSHGVLFAFLFVEQYCSLLDELPHVPNETHHGPHELIAHPVWMLHRILHGFLLRICQQHAR